MTVFKFELIAQFFMGMNHCIILDKTGKIYGLGDNTYGELGGDKMLTTEFTLIKTNFDKKIKEISSGARHVLILLENGELYVMGDNSEGQGYTYSVRLTEPTKVDFDHEVNANVIHCFAGSTHNLVILDNGHVLTWGESLCRKLGYEEEYFSQPTPKVVSCLKEKQVVSVGMGVQMSVIETGKDLVSTFVSPN